MITSLLPQSSRSPAEAISIGQSEAARLTGLSAKTLGRLADAGEPIGRIKLGRRVVFHKPTLEGWLASKAGAARPS